MTEEALPVQANYSKPGFSVLPFLYALYCDGRAEGEEPHDDNFSTTEFKRWRDSGAPNKDPAQDYRGYFDSYVTGERLFPNEAEFLSASEVPALGSSEVVRLRGESFDSIRYVPAPETSRKMTIHVLREITGTPAAEPGRCRELLVRDTEPREAQLSAAAPLLSTLSVMFLKGDRSVWDHYAGESGFSPAVLAVLQRFSRDEVVPLDEARVLIEPLAQELSQPPSRW